ncbi:MAG: CPBP family glutamic-type intramembrane protease [Candidatus Acidiferrales bacterium]
MSAFALAIPAQKHRTAMSSSWKRYAALADVVCLPAFILWFIWRLQFTARWTWIFFVAWIALSFALHHDTPKTMGWRADNIGSATKQAAIVFGAMAIGLAAIGIALGAPGHPPANLLSWRRLGSYFSFCLLQQVALNSLLHNRMLLLIPRKPLAALCTGAIFAALHWPNPVLVPLTFIAGTAMAWMFGRQRNIIPLAIGQALLGSLLIWVFPAPWLHHMRVGPGFYGV